MIPLLPASGSCNTLDCFPYTLLWLGFPQELSLRQRSECESFGERSQDTQEAGKTGSERRHYGQVTWNSVPQGTLGSQVEYVSELTQVRGEEGYLPAIIL